MHFNLLVSYFQAIFVILNHILTLIVMPWKCDSKSRCQKENLYLTFSSWVKHNAFKGLKNCKNIICWTGHYSLKHMDDVNMAKFYWFIWQNILVKRIVLKKWQSSCVENILRLDDKKIFLLFWFIICMNTYIK